MERFPLLKRPADEVLISGLRSVSGGGTNSLKVLLKPLRGKFLHPQMRSTKCQRLCTIFQMEHDRCGH